MILQMMKMKEFKRILQQNLITYHLLTRSKFFNKIYNQILSKISNKTFNKTFLKLKYLAILTMFPNKIKEIPFEYKKLANKNNN